MAMIVCVTGGRDYADRDEVFRVLDRIHAEGGIKSVVHGACSEKGRPLEFRGADRWADEWVLARALEAVDRKSRLPEIRALRFHAYWDCETYFRIHGIPCHGEWIHRGLPHGAAAGPSRNNRMIHGGKPDVLVAFPGGAGTTNCIEAARLYKVKIMPITGEDW